MDDRTPWYRRPFSRTVVLIWVATVSLVAGLYALGLLRGASSELNVAMEVMFTLTFLVGVITIAAIARRHRSDATLFSVWAVIGLSTAIWADLSSGATPLVGIPAIYGAGAVVLWLGYRSLRSE